ncbi:hypothetical protein QBC45DRAFT_338724, partial [Copromyces sp. CBS 386.78]
KCSVFVKNKPGEAGWRQIEEWAEQGILTCTGCMRRPQRAPGKLCRECFKPKGKEN